MMRFQVKANGMPQYAAKLRKLGISLDKLDEPMKDAGEIGLAAVKSYPPYDGSWVNKKESFTPFRPGSKYRRKGDAGGLKTGWEGKLVKGSRIVVRYSIRNNKIKYAKYVQGMEQTSVHAGWWFTIDEWPDKINPHVLKIFQTFMKDIVKKAGL